MRKITISAKNVMCAIIGTTVFFVIILSVRLIAEEKLPSLAAQMYVQFLGEEIGSHSPTERVKFWIGQLESVSQDAEDPVLSNHIIFSLADLHSLINDRSASEKLFSQVFLSQNAPEELRVLAAKSFLEQSRSKNYSLSPDFLVFFEQYEELLVGLSGELKKKYLPDRLKSRILRSDLLMETGKKECESLGQQGTPEANFAIMNDVYNRASEQLSNFLEEFPLLDQNQKNVLSQLNFGVDGALFSLATIKYELGLLSLKTGRQQESQELFDLTVEISSKLLKEYANKSSYVPDALILILSVEDVRGDAKGKQWLERFKEMMPYIQYTGEGLHTFHNYLFDKAVALSKEGTRDIAAELYAALVEQEEKYFPNEYTTHLNYQIGLASSARNYAEIGDSENMEKALEKLKVCDISDPGTREYIKSIIGNANMRIEYTQIHFDSQKERSRYSPLRIFFCTIGIACILWGLYLALTKKEK